MPKATEEQTPPAEETQEKVEATQENTDPNTEVPAFMRNNSVLNDEPEETEEGKEEKKDEKKEEGEEENPEDKDGKKDEKSEKDDKSEEKEEDKKTDKTEKVEDKKEEKKDDKTKTEEKTEKKEDKKTETPPTDQKDAQIDELKKQLATQQAAIDKLTKTTTPPPDDKKKEEEKSKFDKELEMLQTTPVIQPSLPKIEQYQLEDETYDLNNWLKDALRAYTLELQKNLTGGPLAAAQFKVIGQALNEESQSQLQTVQRDQQVTDITTKLGKKFPRLEQDEKVAELFAAKIYAEKKRRFDEVGGDPSKYVDPTYEDYEKMATELLGFIQPPAATETPVEEPTEKLHGNPPLQTDSQPRDEVADDIQAMKDSKKRSSFF